MPLLILVAVAFLLPLVAIVLMPLGLVQRYRAGTARRAARTWWATFNVAAISVSVVLFLSGAAMTNLWVPNAFSYSLAGLAGGSLLGFLGLALTRWEQVAGRLHYHPNRFLVLALTLIVAGRLAYGLWRLWFGVTHGGEDRAWLVHSAVPGSLSVGAVILGYSLTYWIGVSRRARQAQKL